MAAIEKPKKRVAKAAPKVAPKVATKVAPKAKPAVAKPRVKAAGNSNRMIDTHIPGKQRFEFSNGIA